MLLACIIVIFPEKVELLKLHLFLLHSPVQLFIFSSPTLYI